MSERERERERAREREREQERSSDKEIEAGLARQQISRCSYFGFGCSADRPTFQG